MQNKLDYKPDDGKTQDGVFWMQWSDFTTHFEDIYVCRLFKSVEDGGPWYKYTVEGKWSGRTAGGCTNTPEKAQWNPQYYIQPTRPCNIFISIMQKESPGVVAEPDCVGAKLVKKEGKRVKCIYAGESVLSAPYCALRETVC